MTRRALGFTLIEVLAVVLLTSIVLGVAMSHYVNLSRAIERATDHTRDIRKAAALLDRIARDFENVVLVMKDPEADPLTHPWLFYGEPRHSEVGADQLKFTTRGHHPRSSSLHESDFEMVGYATRESEDGSRELLRWSSLQLPESLDREVPADESLGSVLLAEGLASFGVTFIDEAGERTDRWDSSQLVDSSGLPVAVEIDVAFVEAEADELVEPLHYTRRVLLPVRPLDMNELLDPLSLVSGGTGSEADGADDGEGDDEDSDDPLAKARAKCEAGPCAGMTACQAISCDAKLGQYGPSTDTLFGMVRNQPFYDFYASSRSLRWLIDNPACR